MTDEGAGDRLQATISDEHSARTDVSQFPIAAHAAHLIANHVTTACSAVSDSRGSLGHVEGVAGIWPERVHHYPRLTLELYLE